MNKKDKELKKTVNQLKKKVDQLEKDKFDLNNEIERLNEKLQRKSTEIERNKNKTKQYHESINTLGIELKKYKEKHRKEKRNLEKLIFKSDKIINYFHNASVQLGKSIGKMLHHLLIHLEFNMKEIPSKIVNNDISKLYDWIRTLEKNEYLKVRKIFRGMSDKLNFYKKLEIPVLQNAYNRIHSFLKQNEQLAERGEFSMLNATGMNSHLMSRSRSRFLGNESMMSNFKWGESVMDSKILETEKRSDSIPESLCHFHDVLVLKNLHNLTPVLLTDFMKKFKKVIGTVHEQIHGLNLQKKKNQNHSDVLIMDKVLEKTDSNKVRSEYQFHLDCLNEFQEKLKGFEVKIKMIDLILDARNISEEDRKNLKISEILGKNKELNEEDFKLNSEQKSDIELVKMLEDNFIEKKKIFLLKKDFMKYINNLKSEHEKDLSELFDKLNKIEDEYSISQQAIMNLRNALNLNKSELETIKEKLKNSSFESEQVSKEQKVLKEETLKLKEELEKKEEETEMLKKKNEKTNTDIKNYKKNLEINHNEFLENKLVYFENKEKKDYIEELLEKVVEKKENIIKEKEEKKKIFLTKHKELAELIKNLNYEDQETTELQLKLDIIEGKEVQKKCLCDIKIESVNKIENLQKIINKNEEKTQNYDYLTKMITELINHNDSSFNNFIKLTITSQMSLKEKVKKINNGFKEKNKSILEYMINLLKKTFLESVKILCLFILGLGKGNINQDMFIGNLDEFYNLINGKFLDDGNFDVGNVLVLSKQFLKLKEAL